MATVEPGRVRKGRASEFGLLVLALAIGISAYAIVSLVMEGTLPANFYLLTGGMTGLSVALHLLVRWRAPYADPTLVPIAVALNGLGLAMIHRVDLGQQLKGASSELASRQLGWTAVGMAGAVLLLFVLKDHRTLRRNTYTAMIAGLVLILLPLVPGLGKEINGSRVWVGIGPFSLQPAEFAKIAFAVFFAGYLVSNRDTLTLAGRKLLGLQLPRSRDLGPIMVVWLVSIVIMVFEKDLGMSLLFFGLFVAMIYVATERVSWVVIGLVLVGIGAAAASTALPHVSGRFDAWLNAFDSDIYERTFGGSYQIVQGLFGMANGGLMGTGWGAGRPDIVPYASSDFIFAALGEELGLTGVLAILAMYALLVQRGMRIAIGTRDGFGKLLASGLAFVIAWQCFVVIGGITRVIPLTGLTMPFLAYGGSSLLANWLIIALLVRISDNSRRPTPLPLRGTPRAAEGDEPARRPARVPSGAAGVPGAAASADDGTAQVSGPSSSDDATQVVGRGDDETQIVPEPPR